VSSFDDSFERAMAAAKVAPASSTAGRSFTVALEHFLRDLQVLVDRHYDLSPSKVYKRIETSPGRSGGRYVRIVVAEVIGGTPPEFKDGEILGRSAWGFVDKTDGSILKADGWKKPAPQKRGNIYKDNATAGMGPAGPGYIK
jgi:hypothetical protein